jgi:hypothetical protein
MTVGQGLGMLFVGVVALTIGGTIAFFILKDVKHDHVNKDHANIKEKNEQ